MIEDLDGATSEPSRRTHVAVLSAAAAAVSLVLFFALVAPPPIFDGAPPQAASPSPSPSFVTTVASNSRQRPLGLAPFAMCDGGASGEFQLGVPATGAWLSTVLYDRTGRFPVAFVREETGTGRLVLTCVTPDSLVPRINRAR